MDRIQKQISNRVQEAETQYVNNIITEGLGKNDRKPFWRYARAKKQDNIDIAPLRHKGSMTNDSKEKANILNDQFKSMFTKKYVNNAGKVNHRSRI